jgi:hypothetical protein
MSGPAVDSLEIQEGLALHLDPEVLEQHGGTYSCPRALRVENHHVFLCIEAFATRGRWLPLYSEMATRRRVLPTAGRTGHPFWVSGTFHYHEQQVWSAPHEAVIEAARAGHDMSRPGSRNMLARERVPTLA